MNKISFNILSNDVHSYILKFLSINDIISNLSISKNINKLIITEPRYIELLDTIKKIKERPYASCKPYKNFLLELAQKDEWYMLTKLMKFGYAAKHYICYLIGQFPNNEILSSEYKRPKDVVLDFLQFERLGKIYKINIYPFSIRRGAASSGNKEIFLKFEDKCGSFDIRFAKAAIKGRKIEIIKLIMSSSSYQACNNDDILGLALDNGYDECIDMLIKHYIHRDGIILEKCFKWTVIDAKKEISTLLTYGLTIRRISYQLAIWSPQNLGALDDFNCDFQQLWSDVTNNPGNYSRDYSSIKYSICIIFLINKIENYSMDDLYKALSIIIWYDHDEEANTIINYVSKKYNINWNEIIFHVNKKSLHRSMSKKINKFMKL